MHTETEGNRGGTGCSVFPLNVNWVDTRFFVWSIFDGILRPKIINDIPFFLIIYSLFSYRLYTNRLYVGFVNFAVADLYRWSLRNDSMFGALTTVKPRPVVSFFYLFNCIISDLLNGERCTVVCSLSVCSFSLLRVSILY